VSLFPGVRWPGSRLQLKESRGIEKSSKLRGTIPEGARASHVQAQSFSLSDQGSEIGLTMAGSDIKEAEISPNGKSIGSPYASKTTKKTKTKKKTKKKHNKPTKKLTTKKKNKNHKKTQAKQNTTQKERNKKQEKRKKKKNETQNNKAQKRKKNRHKNRKA